LALFERQLDGLRADPPTEYRRVLQVDAKDGLVGLLTRLKPDRADVDARADDDEPEEAILRIVTDSQSVPRPQS
jgi:hypothetical protein